MQPGSQSGEDGNGDQLEKNLERRDEMDVRQTGTPDGSRPEEDQDRAGTTTRGAGNEGTTRY
ncbi:MAG: hypothetical protein ACRDGI_02940 [Candidatus Limnocylindrales bacterium]